MISLSIANAIVIALFTHLLWRIFFYPYLFSPIRHIPYARPDWSSALYRWIYTEPEPPRVVRWIERAHHNGLVRYPGIGYVERVLVLAPEAIREAFVTNAYSTYQKQPLNRQRLATMFGNGLLVAEGDIHRSQRRKLQPAFASKNIRALYPMFWAKACEMIGAVSAQYDKDVEVTGQEFATIELLNFTHRAALDVIGIAAWGKDFNSLSDPRSDFIRSYHAFVAGSPKSNRQAKFIHAAALAVPMSTLATVFPCEFFRNIAEGRRALREACLNVIAEKKAQRARGEQGVDILDQAMSADVFDDDELVEQMRTMLGAGHTTTARSAVWTCYLLAKHSKVQERLRQEIRSELPSPETPDADVGSILERLPYLRAVIHESLRIIPVVPVVRRETVRSTTLLGYHIPSQTSVNGMAWAVNNLESLWGPDAKQFMPERWLSDDMSAPSSAYLTFSTGPRSCIGEAFARAELAALVAVLVGRFDIRLPSSKEDFPNVVWGISAIPIDLKFDLRPIPGY